jgi:hypothetical protein
MHTSFAAGRSYDGGNVDVAGLGHVEEETGVGAERLAL